MLGNALMQQGFARSGLSREDTFFRESVAFDQRSGPAL
jgi:hypothetical protein